MAGQVVSVVMTNKRQLVRDTARQPRIDSSRAAGRALNSTPYTLQSGYK